MANIKELKKKIKSTKGTFKITSAMKLVSAAKLNKAQQAIQNSRPYAKELEDTIKTVSALVQDYSHEYLEESENKKSALLIISSNKGLCAGYNSQLSKKVRNFIAQTGEEIECYFIGKKVKDLVKTEVIVAKEFSFEKIEPTYNEMVDVAEELAAKFKSGEIGRVYVAYNIFESAIAFTPCVKQVLPMVLAEEEKEELKEKFPFDFKYEPTPKEILDSLIPQTYISSVYTSLLDALAAEHGSRMSAMDSASSNCKDAINKLTIKMNKLRQAAITTELIEVVSGAESLNG
ncbi:ATP synthase F1 subunit gamma [Halobacteriovorax marinus]|uniref:ATP synthase gamma chain n=1 Tax=Halobacteriovorax marinus (strain ATCC BAA-682 / DSM 15412 / SJ) TaxID=862908 RepID=E1X1L0_HALMS|nr:ATP synthase F1 subunit gamma [Halobacteriovorax marinus]ATH09438.1 ATP synthase F1 subunit gamma [Halobacteriovorax marinus]CBW28178.1 putative ATP synthase gamma chain [Halobacteriovorax marinus SJ]